MKVRVVVEIEAPEGATHYSEDLLDCPTWWKFQVNSTGVVKAWYYFSFDNNEWRYFQFGNAPDWLKEIQNENIASL